MEFRHRDPFPSSIGDGGITITTLRKHQFNHDVSFSRLRGVTIFGGRDRFDDVDLDAELFEGFSSSGVRGGFAHFDLAAGKFPDAASDGFRRSPGREDLRGSVSVLGRLPHDRRNRDPGDGLESNFAHKSIPRSDLCFSPTSVA